MNLTYFYDTASFDDAKKVYRKKVVELHPDKNANIDIKFIQQLNAQWDYIQNNTNVFPINAPSQPKKKVEPQSTSSFTRNERMEMIKKMLAYLNSKKYKKSWLYYEYVNQCRTHQIKIERFDIEYIGSLLGYNEGWAFHKFKELEI